ncbi:MAG: tetratricopeptide repeat protein [Gemmatimonadota bacterium]
MRRFVPRAFMTAAVAVTAAACAAGGAGVDLGGDLGGRYLVMIPALEGPEGAAVAEELRGLITTNMSTHAALNNAAIRASMSEYDVEELNEIAARQLAQVINVQLVSWGSVSQAGAGLEADVRFIDVGSGDEIPLENVGGATAPELAQAIFDNFQGAVEGIRQAAFCNDYLSSSQFERALETCENALAIVPTSTAALYGKATALLNMEGRNEDALATYEDLLEIDPTHQDALLGAGLAASRLERQDQAMTFYNRYMEVNPGNIDVRMTVANDIAQTGDYISAFRLLEGAGDEAAESEGFQGFLFGIATAAGRRAEELNDPAAEEIYSAALDAYRAAYSNGEDLEPSALRNAIAVNNALGRTDDAIALAEEATQRFADDPQMWSQYATVLNTAERYQEAAQAMTRVIELNPDYENIYIRRAQAYLNANQRQLALADLDQAADRGDPDTVAQVLYGVAVRSIQAEDFADAVSILQPAYQYASGQMRSDIAFYWGYGLYQQGLAIAQANEAGNAQQAQRALTFFRPALERVQESNHAQAAQVADAAQQYIANQEAIIQAANR